MPRLFLANDPLDSIIYEEGQEVSEMYFMLNGLVGIAFNSYSSSVQDGQLQVGQRQQRSQLICDYYVLSNQKALFSYVALQDTRGFCLQADFLNESILPNYRDYSAQIIENSKKYYMTRIYNPMMKVKREYIEELNAKSLGSTIIIKNDLKAMEVPSLENLRQHYMNRRFRKDEMFQSDLLTDDSMFDMITGGITQGSENLIDMLRTTNTQLKSIVNQVEKNNIDF